MRYLKRNLIGGLFGLAAVVVAFGLMFGGVSSASPILGGSAAPHGAAGPSVNTSQSFNFSTNHPTWNTGNLCTPVTSGSTETCTYDGGGHGYSAAEGACGCHAKSALTYNFSGANLNIVVNLSNLQGQAVYLNFVGHGDSIWVNVSGCRGGTLNISLLEQTTFTLNVSASHVKAWIYLYSDADHYVANVSGDCTTIWTYFVSARPKYNECPAGNNTKTDSFLLNITGWADFQGLVFVNGEGYSTPTNLVTGGNWNAVSFENTTTFGCSWSNAPAPTCHHGWGSVSEGAAARSEE